MKANKLSIQKKIVSYFTSNINSCAVTEITIRNGAVTEITIRNGAVTEITI
jgi:hypothetical protein